MPTVHPCLWFDTQAEEAARFYVSVFPNSKVDRVARYGEAGAKAAGRPQGSVMTVEFRLDGQRFLALNGGPGFPFTQAVSLVVPCRDQKEVDRYWDALSKGGEEMPCGWVKDRYGLSWQVTPTVLMDLVNDSDPAKAERAFAAMLTMKKLDVAAIQRAAKGERAAKGR